MRMIVLAVDGLEYDFVEPRKFPFLKQRQYHRVEIPRDCLTYVDGIGYTPFTPVIWTTILTGKKPSEHGVTREDALRHWKNPVLHQLEKIKAVKKLYAKLVSMGVISAKTLEKLGFKRYNPLENIRTILDEAEKPIVIRNPVTTDVKWTSKSVEYFSLEEAVESHVQNFRKAERETLNAIDRDWDLLFTYIKLLDAIGHIYWQRDKTVAKYYRMVDHFAYQVKSRMPKNSILVILSDHGMKPLRNSKVGGEHSCHAFISFSRKVDVPSNLKITDIYYVLKGLLEK